MFDRLLAVVNLCGRSDTYGSFAIHFINPCHRILLDWDEYDTRKTRFRKIYSKKTKIRPDPRIPGI